MENIAESIEKNGFMFEIVYDERSYQDLDIDFDNEEQKQEYINKLDRGIIAIFGVIKKEKCPTCDSWHLIDSLWGIHAESPKEALEVYEY